MAPCSRSRSTQHEVVTKATQIRGLGGWAKSFLISFDISHLVIWSFVSFQSAVLHEADELTIFSNHGERTYAIAFH